MKDVVVILDPEIDVDKYGKVEIDDTEYGSGGDAPQPSEYSMSKTIGAYSPAVDINGILFDHVKIKSCTITVGEGFLPTIQITIVDSDKKLQSYSSLTDIILKLFIRSRNKDFKPIRNNYKITNCTSYETDEDGKTLSMSGVLFIDGLFSDMVKGYSKLSSFDTFLQIAEDLGLGFASNEFNTDDVMTRICPNISLLEFIESDLSLQIYKDDNSFFKVFVDQYYYLNFVEVNQLISVKEEMKKMNEVLTIIDEQNANANEITPEMGEFFLTNISMKSYSQNSIASYDVENNVGSSIATYGDKLYIQNYSLTDREYKEFFIQPLKTEGIDDNYATTETIDPVTKTVHTNEQYNDNVHKNYYFAKANNELNSKNLSKFNLRVSLKDVNNTLCCYKIVPILIEEKATDRMQNEESKEVDEKGLVLDRFLSGFYVSTAIDYIYSDRLMYNKVTCSKREFYKQKPIDLKAKKE